MNRADCLKFVSYVVDDAGDARRYVDGEDLSAARLVGWQSGFEPLFVAVKSYLGVRPARDEAEDLAADYLAEIGWFDSMSDDGARPCVLPAADYVI